MAQGLNAKLGNLLYASNQTPVDNSRGRMGMSGSVMGMSGLAASQVNLKPLAISPTRITRSATVYAVFAIE